DHDERSRGATCSVRFVDWCGARETRANCASLRSACCIVDGSALAGPRYTCGTAVPRAVPDVAYAERHVEPAVGGRRSVQVGVAELGVGEAVPERIQRGHVVFVVPAAAL